MACVKRRKGGWEKKGGYTSSKYTIIVMHLYISRIIFSTYSPLIMVWDATSPIVPSGRKYSTYINTNVCEWGGAPSDGEGEASPNTFSCSDTVSILRNNGISGENGGGVYEGERDRS